MFLSFQWDMLLLEAGLLALFVAPWSLRPAARDDARSRHGSASGCVRWLLFRLMFASGVVKLLHDDPSLPTWHDLTALAYHYETQCLPPWTAWYAHHLPLWWHRVSCALMFVIELAVPFLIFGPRRARLIAGVVFIGFQLLIIATGNYTFFNWLTIALALMLCDDRALAAVLPDALARRGRDAGAARRRPAGVRTARRRCRPCCSCSSRATLDLRAADGRARRRAGRCASAPPAARAASAASTATASSPA